MLPATKLVLVFIGGIIGTLIRYVLFLGAVAMESNYLGMIFINVSGSFLLGLLIGYLRSKENTEKVLLLIGTGLLGSYTTFSGFIVDSYFIPSSENILITIAYMGTTIVLALSLAIIGLAIGQKKGNK